MERLILVIVTYNRLELLKECVEAVRLQTYPFTSCVIVDNASTDGTREYLDTLAGDEFYNIYREEKNIGGSGGFADGIRIASEMGADWITLIDDDAILRLDYHEQIIRGIGRWGKECQAFTGVPLTGGLRIGHRRRVSGRLIRKENAVPAEEYGKEYFFCDIGSFCGLTVSGSLVKKIGFPERGYFIWYDDTEYCLRMMDYTRICNCCAAVIDHKADPGGSEYRIGWKDYYGIRNRIDMALRHYGRPTAMYIAFRKRLRILWDFLYFTVKSGLPEGRRVCRLYTDALRDGFTGRLGLREPYLPSGYKT